MWRYVCMNAGPTIQELSRIRRDIGVKLRIETEVLEPPSQLLMALLKELEIREAHVEGQRLFAEVEAHVAGAVARSWPASGGGTALTASETGCGTRRPFGLRRTRCTYRS